MEIELNTSSTSTANVSEVSNALPLPTLITYISFSTLGITGNGLVLYVIARVKVLQDTTNLLIVNQSLIDFISSILLLANYALPKPPLPSENPLLARFLCGLWYSHYLFWTTFIASLVNLLLLTLERYCAVIYPIRYRRHVKYKLVIGCSLIPWMIGLLHTSYLITLTKVEDQSCVIFIWPNTIMQTAMGIFTFVMYFMVTFSAMFFMYVRILKTLRRGPKTAVGSVHQAKDYRTLARRNAVKTMISLSLCYATCWAPFQFTYLLYCLGVDINIRGTCFRATICIAFTNMWINPFIYTFQYHKFQNGLKKVFGCLRRRGHEVKIQSVHNIDMPSSRV